MKNFNLHAFADEAGQDLNEQIAALRDNGYEGMEIRNVEGQNVSALTLERAKEIDKRMKDAGLCVWSIGSPIGKISLEDDFEKHMDLYKHTLEVSAVFEARAFRLFSFYMPKDETDFSKYKNEVIERMGRFAEEAKQYDIKICHENEKGIYGDIATRCLEIHKAIPELGGIFDPANFIQCKQDTLEAWDMLNPYVDYLHIKDANQSGTVVPAGKGIGHVGVILKKYYEMGGRDLTLEPHLRVFDGLKELEKDFNEKEIDGMIVYPTARAAFDAAVKALNGLIEEV
ncbi:MAG: sugar phosphate isomerase/epimerase [Tyzzerella sp.]|nr:sugar phosphate isomerase/epimerase [Tyzzerella sp.]